MDFLNLDSRGSKLQKEQQKRRDAAKLRIQRERRNKEAAARDQARVEQQIKARKLEQRRKEEQARKLEEADLIRTGGVRYKETLLAVTADGEGDKILLPPSALDSLSRQDAVSMGPMLFELSVVTASPSAVREGGATNDAIVSRTTHAGVLEFVADEGTVGLPRKVVSSLLGTLAQKTSVPSDEGKMSPRQGDQPESGGSGVGDRSDANQDASSRPAVEGLGTVVVRYVRLAKATFARVVPETVGLSQVSELRAMLEHNMRNHATLSVGDRLTVWRRGKEFGMKVVELRPESQVTVIDTDMEIELDLPEEAREQLEEKGARDRAKTLRAHMNVAPSSATVSNSPVQSLSPVSGFARSGGNVLGGRTGPAAATTTGPSPMDDSDDDSDVDSDEEAAAKKKNVFDPERHRQTKLEELPEEPTRGTDGVFTCQLRSSREKFTRRFYFEDGVGMLLDFAEANGGVPGQYRLVVPFPRRVLTREDAFTGLTLRDAGLTSKQESVILESL